jgi:DNA topoisomerase-1
MFEGWLKADPDSRGEEVTLPKVSEGDVLNLIEARSIEKDTQPPPRYTEAGLIKELEKRGIGRPSTYASIIRTIEERGYVEKEGKSLKPTDTGDVVSSFLEDNFPSYISDTFTAEMEDKLDGIADGTQEYETTLSKFYKPFQKEVKEKSKLDKATNLGEADEKYKCPKCGSSMTIKLGRGGKFLSCSKYPDCDGALTIEGQEIKKDEPIGIDPTTNLPIYVLVGRFGPYVQLGEKAPKGAKKPRKKKGDTTPTEVVAKPKMASIPKGVDFTKVTVADALKYLSVPRVLGVHPTTGQKITANIGRFGPYIVHESDFRSLKTPDDVYTIELPRALEILSQPKAVRKGRFVKKKV